jgi:hypothetical protein
MLFPYCVSNNKMGVTIQKGEVSPSLQPALRAVGPMRGLPLPPLLGAKSPQTPIPAADESPSAMAAE